MIAFKPTPAQQHSNESNYCAHLAGLPVHSTLLTWLWQLHILAQLCCQHRDALLLLTCCLQRIAQASVALLPHFAGSRKPLCQAWQVLMWRGMLFGHVTYLQHTIELCSGAFAGNLGHFNATVQACALH